MLVAPPKHHRQVIATLELRIVLKEDTRSLFLLVMPFALRFKQQMPAPGQKLFGGIAVLVHNRGIGLAFLARLFHMVVLLLEGRSPQLDPDVLHRLGDELLDMKSIRHELGAGKAWLDRQLHIRGHIQGHLGNDRPRTGREFVEHLSYITRFRALNHRDEGPLLSVGGLVRKRGPELAVRDGHLVNAQMGAEIRWKEHPVFSVLVLLPVREATEMVFVLLLEFLGLQLVGSCNGRERDRLSLGLMLLKNPRTPAPGGCRGNRAGSHVSDTRPGLPASNSVVGRSAVCVSPAGENP